MASTARLLSLSDAAEILGCSPKTVRRYIAAGRLTGYKVGPRLVRVSAESVDSLMHRIPSAGDAA